MLTHFRRFADYNKWANGKLYDACAQLSEAEYFKARPTFFGSIHRTLNHLVVGDIIWTSRLGGSSPSIPLNKELYTDLATLRTTRETMDDDLIAYMAAQSESDMSGDVEFKTTSGDAHSMVRGVILQHFFNHQTHHWGQVHDMLSQTDVAPPVLDLLYYLRG